MDYVRLISDAWSMMWRHRFLWILGLFAGSGAGSCSGPNFNFSFQAPSGWDSGGDYQDPTFDAFTRWAADNVTWLIAAGVVLILLILALLVISLIAQGGMAQATADIARGRPSSLGSAIRAGRRLLWRYLGLWLLLSAVALVLALFVAGVVVFGIALSTMVGEGARILLIVVTVILIFLAVLVAIPLSILVSIVVTYAQRAIAVEDVGPLRALGIGASLLRTYLGRSLLVWLISIGLGIAIGIAIFVITLLIAVPLGALGLAIYLAFGLHILTIVYAVGAGLLAFVILWALSALLNTYSWSYWTLAYLRLPGEAQSFPEGTGPSVV